MTEIQFIFTDELLTGFHMTGHSTASAEDEAGRLVCSAISSAAYLTANTVTEIIGAKADIKVDEEKGEMFFKVKSDFEDAVATLCGFKLHMEQLSGQFPEHITIISEV